jgi:hypothetical protein
MAPQDPPRGSKRERHTTGRSDDSRRGRAVQFFRDIHGTERLWRRVPALEEFAAGGDQVPAYGVVVCTNRRGANAR